MANWICCIWIAISVTAYFLKETILKLVSPNPVVKEKGKFETEFERRVQDIFMSGNLSMYIPPFFALVGLDLLWTVLGMTVFNIHPNAQYYINFGPFALPLSASYFSYLGIIAAELVSGYLWLHKGISEGNDSTWICRISAVILPVVAISIGSLATYYVYFNLSEIIMPLFIRVALLITIFVMSVATPFVTAFVGVKIFPLIESLLYTTLFLIPYLLTRIWKFFAEIKWGNIFELFIEIAALMPTGILANLLQKLAQIKISRKPKRLGLMIYKPAPVFINEKTTVLSLEKMISATDLCTGDRVVNFEALGNPSMGWLSLNGGKAYIYTAPDFTPPKNIIRRMFWFPPVKAVIQIKAKATDGCVQKVNLCLVFTEQIRKTGGKNHNFERLSANKLVKFCKEEARIL